MNRRKAIKLTAGLAGIALVGCTGKINPGLILPRKACTKESVMNSNKVLVAYATRCGSTASIAEAIGKTLCEKGLSADVQPVQEVKAITDYSSIIVGSPVRIGKLMPEARKFVNKNKNAFAQKKTAFFVVCLTMKDDTPKNRETAEGYLRPFTQVAAPLSKGLFAGSMDMTKMGGIVGWMMRQDKSGKLKTEDCRNWEAIKAWSEELAGKLG